jgi:hypothetical protein
MNKIFAAGTSRKARLEQAAGSKNKSLFGNGSI